VVGVYDNEHEHDDDDFDFDQSFYFDHKYQPIDQPDDLNESVNEPDDFN